MRNKIKKKRSRRHKKGYYTIAGKNRSFVGRNGWGYDEVYFNEINKVVWLRQPPHGFWKKGDKVPKSIVRGLKDRS